MSIPVLDWQDFDENQESFVKKIGDACRNTGFFMLTGHGLDPSLLREVFEQSKDFFDLPTPTKEELSIYKSPANRGWSMQGSENLDGTGRYRDIKEAFNIGLPLPADDPRILRGEPFRGVNVWPDKLPMFRETMLQYFEYMLQLSRQVHRALAMDLGLPSADYFDQHLDAPLATLRLLKYPGSDLTEETTQSTIDEIGCGEHTDYGSLTFILATTTGLQIRPRNTNKWIDVPKDRDDAIVVNIADCLQRWTNDIYVSTPHRVLRPTSTRYSLAFFVDPNPDSVIQMLPMRASKNKEQHMNHDPVGDDEMRQVGMKASKYTPITSAEYLAMRLNETYESKLV